MSSRKYSYIFSPVLSSGNISSQLLTGLYNLEFYMKEVGHQEVGHQKEGHQEVGHQEVGPINNWLP